MKALIALVSVATLSLSVASAGTLAEYQSQTAALKQSTLWNQISSHPYTEMPALTGRKIDLDFFTSFAHLEKSFTHTSDEMISGRPKVIHKWGSAVQVVLKTNTNHPFTGLFKSGAIGIARMSLALPYKKGESFVPGLAVKLLVDGQPSKNIFVMEKLEGQGDDTNYFKSPFTNILPNPTSKSTKVGRWVFERFVEDAIHLNVEHVASVTSSGEAVSTVNSPFQLVFKPVDGLALASDSSDFRVDLAGIKPGTVLYTVYGKATADENSPVYEIGQLITTSEFVASQYEDETLYFQHAGATLRSGFIRWIW